MRPLRSFGIGAGNREVRSAFNAEKCGDTFETHCHGNVRHEASPDSPVEAADEVEALAIERTHLAVHARTLVCIGNPARRVSNLFVEMAPCHTESPLSEVQLHLRELEQELIVAVRPPRLFEQRLDI